MGLIHSLESEKASLEVMPLISRVFNPNENESSNVNVYHGTRDVNTALSVLNSGGAKSPARRRESDDNYINVGINRLVEDVFRLLEDPEDDLNLIDFARENREILREDASPETNQFIDKDMEEYFGSSFGSPILSDQGSYDPLRNYCVSVGDGITYHVSNRAEENGVALEFSVPKESVINYGIEGNVPGEIPLEYATAIYHGTGVSAAEIDELENHPATHQHGLEVIPTEVYRQNSDLF